MMTQGRRLFFFLIAILPWSCKVALAQPLFRPGAGSARRFQDLWREGMRKMPRDLWCRGHTGSGPRAHTEIPIIL